MRNLILWAHQATVDHTYRVGDEVGAVVGKILQQGGLIANAHRDKVGHELKTSLEDIHLNGLREDRWIDVSGLAGLDVAAELEQVKLLLGDYDHESHVGGNPAISAVRGHLLRQGPERTDLPQAFFAGLYPRSVDEVVEAKKRQDADKKDPSHEGDAFRGKMKIEARPQTIGIETHRAKLGLIHGPGRSLAHLAHGKFSGYLDEIESIAATIEGRTVFAMNAPTPRLVEVDGERISEVALGMRLIEAVRGRLGERARIFVATRGFPSDTEAAHAAASSTLELLNKADVVSMSDSELQRLHTAERGEAHEDPLAYKLRELPFEAIKVCHSADGVIMDLGCRPERIINSDRFAASPAQYLEETLRLSADGASYALDATAGLGRSANEAMVRIYSHNVADENRNRDRFRATFLDAAEPMPAGMVSIASARVVRTLGAVVGIGAIFDGLLLSFLMRS